MAARPKTLPAAVAPVLLGTAMAYADGGFHAVSALCAFLGALLIQIGANLANDYFDHAKGADTAVRLGPTRVTQAGLIAPGKVLAASVAAFALACVPGLYIVIRGGWPFVVVGLASIACGILYTAGPYPLGYLGLGDLLVLVFFGPVAVAGTYYVQALELSRPIMIAGFGPGLLSVAILTVNNLRDVDQDREAGKKTLPVRFGRTFAKAEYLACFVVACLGVPAGMAIGNGRWWVLIAALTLVAALPTIAVILRVPSRKPVCPFQVRSMGVDYDYDYEHEHEHEARSAKPETLNPRPETLNDALAATGKLLLLYSVLLSIGWML
jgi:1,4-dihydroxy-2-naphthoate octaprenyltransferase